VHDTRHILGLFSLFHLYILIFFNDDRDLFTFRDGLGVFYNFFGKNF